MIGKEQSIRVNYDLDPFVDQVLVDKLQIQQVLLNLAGKAWHDLAADQRDQKDDDANPDADRVVGVAIQKDLCV